jgi:hypothetical protein
MALTISPRIGFAVLALLVPAAAEACRTEARVELADVRFADTVVVGTITNYRIVRDEAFRKRMLALPTLPSGMRDLYSDPRQNLMPDHARFVIEVREVLFGKAPRRLTVTWDNSTFGEPATMSPGPYLIALRRPASPLPPLRGASATILPSPDPTIPTVLQAPCASPFLYPAGSEQARAIRRLLKPPRP